MSLWRVIGLIYAVADGAIILIAMLLYWQDCRHRRQAAIQTPQVPRVPVPS